MQILKKNEATHPMRSISIETETGRMTLNYPVYPSNSNEHELIFRTEMGQAEDIVVEKLSNGFKLIIVGDWETDEFLNLIAEVIKARELPHERNKNSTFSLSIEPEHYDNQEYSQLFESFPGSSN